MAEVSFIDISAEIHADPRGTIFFPWQGRFRDPQDLLQTFHLISIQPGQTRGNHYHPGHAEWLYVFDGVGLFLWQESGKIKEREIAGNHTMVYIPSGVAHTLHNPGPGAVYLLAWRERTGANAGEPETVPQPLMAGR